MGTGSLVASAPLFLRFLQLFSVSFFPIVGEAAKESAELEAASCKAALEEALAWQNPRCSL